MMTTILHGTVRGNTIELEGDIGLEDGRKVEIIVRTKDLPGPPPFWKAGSTETAAGMMAPYWTEEDDRILSGIQLDRKKERHHRLAE